ncbi:hypothetical protein ACJJTC_013334 [Scirpophaga incertulas]
MMSEYYDHYHRWEPLAEFHFSINGDSNEEYFDEDNYIYCLCSRAFIRDGVRTYYVEKEDYSESDVEVVQESQSQECDDQSHVHFSLDTSYKVKCEKDEGVSCYCSASHTDNYCSTDEHDPPQAHGSNSHALQPSDSGADLTYPDCHSDNTTHDKMERMEHDVLLENITECDENYHSETTWEKFWAVNGERLIWASWIKKYSDYINPQYLDENNDLLMDENNVPKQRSADQIFNQQTDIIIKEDADDSIRERKFSYDSKINPYKKGTNSQNTSNKNNKTNDLDNSDDAWLPLARKRSCSEHDRILSPRTVTGTDSMTNVTKMTLSSYDISSSHVTSESTPTDDYSLSSSTSDDQSNDQTRIANIDENVDQAPSEELDTQQFWQLLWKKHFGEQYAYHYGNYLQTQGENKKDDSIDIPVINIVETAVINDKTGDKLELECENSEGNSQEMPTVIEVQAKVDNIKLEDKDVKTKKEIKKNTNRIINSVGTLLQTLLKDEKLRNELCELGEDSGSSNTNKNDPVPVDVVDGRSATTNVPQSISSTNLTYSYDDGDDDPPEDKPISLKRSHEVDEEEVAAEKIKTTIEIMGFCVNSENLPKGQLVRRKRFGRLRPPRYKRFGVARKTYYDDDGNPCDVQDSPEEKDNVHTDEEAPNVNSDNEVTKDGKTENRGSTTDMTQNKVEVKEESNTAKEDPIPSLSSDLEASFNSVQDNSDEQKAITKRRRRPRRQVRCDKNDSDIPAELRDTPKMLKYWKKRHSLFHRFDEGIKLDLESWFSVTPESVAWHIAKKYAYHTVIDAFCGAGGNTIQFARTCQKVIAIDIDPVKVEMARHNAGVYGVAERVHFVVGDFFALAPQLEADMVFLSPPWGGPRYADNYEYDLETMLEPKPASELIDITRNITTNFALYLPRNTKTDQLLSIAKEIGSSIEIEQSYLGKRYVAITAYFYQNEDV